MSRNLRQKAKGICVEAVRVKEVQTLLSGLHCLLCSPWLPTFRADGLGQCWFIVFVIFLPLCLPSAFQHFEATVLYPVKLLVKGQGRIRFQETTIAGGEAK